MGKELSDRVENIVGKGEIAPFPTMFSKGVCCLWSKRLILFFCNCYFEEIYFTGKYVKLFITQSQL